VTLEPNDIAAEQAALGCMLSSPAAAEQLRPLLVAEDFYRPAHQVIFAAIVAVMADVMPDPVTVLEHLQRSGSADVTGGAPYLHTLMTSAPLVLNAPVYAATVRRHAVTRRLRMAAYRVLDLTEPGTAADPAAMTEEAIREFESVRTQGGVQATAQPADLFLGDEGEDAYDWVIEGLLERGDRLMLTGMEGAGKSVLLRQLAVCAAAGVHPFSLKRITPVRALLVDAENGTRLVRRKLRPLTALAQRHGDYEPGRLWIESQPAGADLTSDKGVSWLLRQVAAARPDITCIGPLYKMNPRAIRDDSDAAPILAAFDMIRARGSCVVVECHAGHALGPGGLRDLRPRGSAALLGYPEFGYGLRWAEAEIPGVRMVEFTSWRGDRDERNWPEMLNDAGIWPWSASL
jgi:replicative DNA helicase